MPRLKRYGEKKQSSESGGDSWIMSYGDMMTLLCTFFILLLSFSNIEIEKFRKFLGSLQGSSGVLGEQDGKSIFENDMAKPDVSEVTQDIIQDFIEGMEEEQSAWVQDGDFSVEQTDDGLLIKVTDPMLFAPGDDYLKPGASKLLDQIYSLISLLDCDVRIEGHTDNQPISSARLQSNWDLSTSRAMKVAKYFMEKHDINPLRLTALGRGEFVPVADNKTAAGRGKNRRVEIYITYEMKSGLDLLNSRSNYGFK